MSHSQPNPGTTYKSPIDVKTMIHTLERDRNSSREVSPADSTSGLTKSRSFNDLHLVEDDWVSLDPKLIKKLPPMLPPSPTAGKPPKPPARKKKMQGPAKSTDDGRSEKTLAARLLPRRPGSEEIKKIVVIPTKTEEPRKVSPILPPKVPKLPYPAAQNGNLAPVTVSGPIPTSNSFSTAQTKQAAKTISSKVC